MAEDFPSRGLVHVSTLYNEETDENWRGLVTRSENRRMDPTTKIHATKSRESRFYSRWTACLTSKFFWNAGQAGALTRTFPFPCIVVGLVTSPCTPTFAFASLRMPTTRFKCRAARSGNDSGLFKCISGPLQKPRAVSQTFYGFNVLPGFAQLPPSRETYGSGGCWRPTGRETRDGVPGKILMLYMLV